MMNGLPERPPRSDVCAIMVTYHPDDGFASRLNRVAPQVRATFIVDNGSRDDSVRMLRELALPPAFTLIENQDNLGIARALNIGVQRALSQGYAWALLLDQDTQIDEDMVEVLLATYASFPDAEHLAVVGSRFRDTKGRLAEPSYLGPSGERWEEVESVITSGSLLSLEAYTAIGPFRDEFFIDHVDTEYCFRARAAGYRVIETRQPLMSHTVGSPTLHRVLWSAKWTTNHSPDRRYYMARNNTVLLREYGTARGGSWLWKSMVRSFRLCKRIAYFETDKVAKIAAVYQGWRDGVRGNMGPRGRARGARKADAAPKR